LSSAFTLIELILVMAILTMAVSVTAPALSHFFRGRALDAEARRLLALTHGGQSRAVAEGVPVDLWVDAKQSKYGLQIEPSYETEDPKKVEFPLDSGLQIEVVSHNPVAPVRAPSSSTGRTVSTASVPKVALVHPELPTVRFLPDGSISESSPEKIRLVGREGASLWLIQTSDHLAYEIRTTDNPDK
jgi:prepilin-type N-terminal cleavage/methylation domain-containing protein